MSAATRLRLRALCLVGAAVVALAACSREPARRVISLIAAF